MPVAGQPRDRQQVPLAIGQGCFTDDSFGFIAEVGGDLDVLANGTGS